jgi:hypothetical protein
MKNNSGVNSAIEKAEQKALNEKRVIRKKSQRTGNKKLISRNNELETFVSLASRNFSTKF